MMPLHRLGQDDVAGPLAEHARELLGVQRVAAGVLEQPCLHTGLDDRAPEERVQEGHGLVLRERREQDRRRVDLSASPARTTDEQLRAGGAEHEQRNAARPLDEVVDEVEQRVVGPMQVLEDEDERTLFRERLEEPAPGRERLAALRRPPSPSRCRGRRADAGAARPTRPRRRPAGPSGPARLELLGRLARAFGLEDSGLRLDDLPERPERDAFAVRKRAAVAPVDEPELSRLDRLEELEDQPALADPGDADERQELRRALARDADERLAEKVELPLAADEEAPPDRFDSDACARREAPP